MRDVEDDSDEEDAVLDELGALFDMSYCPNIELILETEKEDDDFSEPEDEDVPEDEEDQLPALGKG